MESNLYTQLDRLNLKVNEGFKGDIKEFKEFIGKKYSKNYILALSKKFGAYYVQTELYNMFQQYKDHLKECTKYNDIDFYNVKVNRYNGSIPYGYIEELSRDILESEEKINIKSN